MSTSPNPSAAPGLPSFRSILDNAQLVWRLLQDDRVSTVLKVAIPLAVAVYFIMPFDLLPDFIPGLGQLDDIGVITGSIDTDKVDARPRSWFRKGSKAVCPIKVHWPPWCISWSAV